MTVKKKKLRQDKKEKCSLENLSKISGGEYNYIQICDEIKPKVKKTPNDKLGPK